MKAVVLAAGKGKRMMPLTESIPKPLIEVNGKPIMDYTLENIAPKVKEIVIVIGYKGDQIVKRYGDNFKGIPLRYVVQEEQLGTADALLCAKDYLDEEFLFVQADDFFDKEIFDQLKPAPCVVAAKVENPERFGILHVENEIVKDVEEKPEHPESDLVNTGLWVMTPKVIELAESLEKSPRGEYELTDALKELIKSDTVHCVQIEKGWIPLGYPDDIKKVEKYLGEVK